MKKKQNNPYVGLGIAMSLVFWFLLDNLAIGIALGIVFALVFASIEKKK